MAMLSMIFVSAVALTLAVWIVVFLARSAWELRQYEWTRGELAGFGLLCVIPVTLTVAACVMIDYVWKGMK